MKTLSKILFLGLITGFLIQCSKSGDPSATSTVIVKMSAATSNGSAIINGRTAFFAGSRSTADSANGITISDVKVNVRDIKFEFSEMDKHFGESEYKKDSSYSEDGEGKLRGPFLVDLMNAGAFIDQVVTTVNIPNGVYERVKFKLSPSSATGDMFGKSILITGKIDTIPFIFWHKRDANFGVRFHSSDSTSVSDSTSLSTNGQALSLAIHLELDKVFNAFNGADLSKAMDKNKDGVITIDPDNTDGNKWIADQIMMLLIRHAHCERKDHDH